ncbi:MAG: beta strand repeat-containing protein, partial [Parasphingopyxis sp.]
LTIANSLRVDAQTNGQTSLATAGSASLTVRNSATLDIGDSLDISTSASGGNLGVENQAGTIDILADGASLTFDDLSLDAFSQLGDFGGSNPADAAAGGSIAITSTGGGQIVGDGFATINVNANATTASDGATGRGGSIVFDANGGTIQIGGSSFVDASGVGNSNSDPTDLANRGLGTGGTITYRVRNAGTMSFANVFANSDGSVQFDVEGGGAEPVGEGGLGFGGQVIFDLIDGTFTANNFEIGANGSGGPGGGDVITVPALAALSLFEIDYSSRPAGFGPIGVMPFALPVDPGANGGDGTGGTVTFNLNGGTATVANLTVSANGFGGAGGTGDGDLGIGAGNGGNGFGGAATFNAINGSLTITGTLTVASNGTGGNGGFGDGADAGSGGNGLGGTATFDLDGNATIDSSIVLVATDGFGGDGGSAGQSFGGLDGGPGGDGGSGTGGDATFNNTAGTISFGTLTAQSTGTGGSGGGNFGISVGDAVDDGGAGGDGIGGNATINLNQDDLTSPSYTVEANGVGGAGGSGLDAGDGGNAFGGTAALNINNAQVLLDDPTVRAIATGGNGSFSDGIGGNGGNGGTASGGVARIEVSGANGSIPITFVILESDGTGGNGGDGGATAFGLGGIAGDGGNGGDGSGGSSELVARTGGTMTIAGSGFVVSSTGTGGTGGTGGNIDMVGGGIAGDGGDGGSGTGGSPTLLAQGGTITADDITLTGAGTGGNGGTGGTDFVVQIGADGNGGDGTGGNPVIEVQEGSPGIIMLGATSMLADGTGGTGTLGGSSFGGRIDIVDTSTDPAGLITMDSLTASALTGSSGATSGFFMSANSGPIAVAGDVTINVGGNAEFAFDGDGQMTVGGNMDVTSGASILVSHSNNGAPTDSLDIAGAFTAAAQGDFNAMAGSRIASGDVTDIRTEGDASAADLTAFGRIDLSAGQDATLGNGAVTGGPLAVIRIDAGSDDDPTSPLYDPQYNAAITGTVSSTGNVRVFAGGNAIFRNGSTTSADNRVEVQTGDDIIVESGATISAGVNPGTAPNPSDPFNDQAIVNLNAGGLGLSLLSPILTPISSIIVAGTLEATNTAVVLNADAIDGLGGAINASSISTDVNNAPPNGVVQSDDAGLLSANCLEGNICLGTLGADNRVEIGQSGVPISATIEGGSVAANAILITTRRDLVVGTDGIVSTFDGSSEILFESTEGDIELRAATISSDLLQISAASGSLLGTGSLSSANDVGITVARDIFAAGIFAGRELTTVANMGGGLEGGYSVPGSIDVGTFSQGVGDANIDAGGDIAFGQVNVSSGNDIILLAPSGNVFLGATSGATNISIFGVNVEIGSIDADDLIDIGASADIFGTDAAAGGDIDLAAGGNID